MGILKSDLLLSETVKSSLEELEETKAWMIYAATGQTPKNDEEVLEHLLTINHLQQNLKDLFNDLEAGLISFDAENAWGK